MKNLVSIVVPVYNVEEYLNRCIESIVNQTYKNLEIILIDDGSTDSCPQMCDDWAKKDNRIKVIHKENAGAGMARNTGIDSVTGDYIFFIDGDDYVSVHLVEKCIRCVENQDADVVIFGHYDVFEDEKIVEKNINTKYSSFNNKSIRSELLPAMLTYKFGFGMSVWGKMYKAQTVKNLNIRFVSEREIFSEDVYFTIEFLADVNKAIILNDNLYYYSVRENSLSRAFNPNRHQMQNDYFYKKTTDMAISKKLPAKVLDSIASRYHTYSIANMKQIVLTETDKKVKKELLHMFFHNETLLPTLTDDVLHLNEYKSQVFWKLFRRKQFLLCYLLLYIKAKS